MGRTVPSYRLQPKMKEANGNYSGNDWTRKTEIRLVKCSLIHDCITLPAVMLEELG
jgi:hypothetical protein